MLKRGMPPYMYTQEPRYDPIGFMEYQNFLMFQERMCVVFQITMVMFCMLLLCMILSMFLESL